MTTERRLIDTFDAARRYEPSPDLWHRVVHSIEEDRRHRRRVWTVGLGIAAALVTAVVIAAVNLESRGPTLGGRYRFDWRTMEALEFGGLLVLVASLGPAIRRFGRGYVGDVFRGSPDTGARLLGLLDVAYYLVFSGYVLVTLRLAAPVSYRLFDAADQVEEAAARIGGLLLAMGLLHAATLVAIPLVGLVFNTTKAGRKLPRWVVIGLAIGGAAAGFVAVNAGIGLVAGLR